MFPSDTTRDTIQCQNSAQYAVFLVCTLPLLKLILSPEKHVSVKSAVATIVMMFM